MTAPNQFQASYKSLKMIIELARLAAAAGAMASHINTLSLTDNISYESNG
jgi:hypothetical protein